jgi:acetolactate synthase-1/3 small subunit
MKMHIFTVYVEDRPGVLNRVASLFRRRNFNITSLAVGHSETPGVSRMTIVVQTDGGGAQRIAAHLYKLINVLRVEDITDRAAVVRDLALIKVSADRAAGRGLWRTRGRCGAAVHRDRDGGIRGED